MPVDKQKVDVEDTVTISREEYDALTAGPNPAPAVEEGPHLKERSVRAAKREQMHAMGITADDETITDDMRAIMKEKT